MNALNIQETPKPKVFICVMKSRQEMEKDISADLLSWWHDILPGKTVVLREATAEDIQRSWIRSKAPRDPNAYMIELEPYRCLILKKAIKKIVEFKEENK